MKILAVIAARGGSKGVKDKNIRTLAGKPLILYTIEQVIKWGKFDKFIVSTDSKAIANIALSYGAEVPFMRPATLADDNIGKIEVLRYTLIESEKYYKMRFDILLDLDATSPIRTVKDIDNIVKLFKEKKADSVFSVTNARKNPYFNMVEKQLDGSVVLSKKPLQSIKRRQDAPEVYEMNASMYVYKRKFLLDVNNSLPYSKTAYVYEMNESGAIDIDTEINFRFIEFLVKEGAIKL
jgi:CMP-N-acetylneuraminic acid synthetase